MKQKDIALIIIVIFISGLLSFFVSKALFKTPSKSERVEVVEKISPDFSKPDSKYFNADAVDPTQLITIGQSNNVQPFNGQTSQ